MDRLEITLTGDLPDDTKYGILAEAQLKARELAEALSKAHSITLTASVKLVRPGKTKAPPAVAAVPEAPSQEPTNEAAPTIHQRGQRHAAE